MTPNVVSPLPRIVPSGGATIGGRVIPGGVCISLRLDLSPTNRKLDYRSYEFLLRTLQ